MIDVGNPEAMIAEARRRDERRAKNMPLHATVAELEHQEMIADDRLEKEIQADVRKLYIAYGCTVYSLSQARASKQSPGLGDLYVIHERCGAVWWHETKTPRGKQSPAQLEFQRLHWGTGVEMAVGGIRAAEDHLIAIGAAYRTATGALESRHNREA